MKNIAIAGGAGFIGSNLAHALLLQGHHVWVIDNFATGSKINITNLTTHPHFHFVQKDVSDPSIVDALSSQAFDTIYHLASPASPIQYIKMPLETMLANSLGTLHLLELSKKSKKTTFVLASTSEVYGDPLEHPQKETYWGNVNPNGPRSCYDESKRFAEALCMTFLRLHGTDIRIARIFNTYGPNMQKNDGRVISNFIVQALKGNDITVYGDGSQTRSFCFVSDMVNGLISLASRPVKGEVINMGNDEEHSINDIAQTVKKMTASTSKTVYKPLPQDDPQRRKPDLTKAKSLLSYQAEVSLSDGLTQTIAYFKERFSL